jgi:hypothetical protein
LQALTLLNDTQFHELAVHIARQMASARGTDADRIAGGFLRCTARRPAPEESQRLLRLLHEERSADGSDGAPPEAGWLAVARVLLNLDETITRE